MLVRSIFLCALLVGCGSEASGHREVVLRTRGVTEPALGSDLLTASGWSVQLTSAELSIAALYYFEGPPLLARAARPRRSFERATLGLLSVARAHPGHYTAGRALGQMIAPSSLDLAAGELALPEGLGITGTYRSARVVLAPQGAAEPGAVARVEGVARRGEHTVFFVLAATQEEVARSAPGGRVDGCRFEEADVRGDGLVSMIVRPAVWLRLVDFSDVAPGSAAAPTEVAAGQTARIAFALGLAQLDAYSFRFSP